MDMMEENKMVCFGEQRVTRYASSSELFPPGFISLDNLTCSSSNMCVAGRINPKDHGPHGLA